MVLAETYPVRFPSSRVNIEVALKTRQIQYTWYAERATAVVARVRHGFRVMLSYGKGGTRFYQVPDMGELYLIQKNENKKRLREHV